MKKKFLVLLLLAMTFSGFAQTGNIPPTGKVKPGRDEVIVVLKVNLTIDISKDFIAKTRNVQNTESVDKFKVYSESKTLQNLKFDAGENAIFVAKKNKNIGSLPYFEYFFFGADSCSFFVPTDFTFVVPDKTEAVYLGSFNIVVNSNYEIVDIKRYDEYEDGQKALDTAYEKHIDLVRIEDLFVEKSN